MFIFQSEDVNAVRLSHTSCLFLCAVGEKYEFRFLVEQEFYYLLRQLVHANDGDAGIVQVNLFLLNYLNSGKRMAHRSMTYLCLASHALAYLQCTLKQLVHTSRQFLCALCCHICLFNLALYSLFAYDGRLQTASHSEQMACYLIGNITIAIVQFHTVACL